MKRIIDLERITAVLMGDGHWHKIRKGTFKVDGYINAEAGQCNISKGISQTDGATWVNADTVEGIACPITSIGGFKYEKRTNDVSDI